MCSTGFIRACRGGNYIAFFRLARKATYLQACLMHAHFSKLRTEALAMLHSGLQKNQGVPVTQVVKWLGMESEDIETLVEYHGFSIKSFEKEYVIKDGPLLNRDAEYETRRSRLVEAKRSSTIVEDVEGKGQQQPVVDSWVATPMTPGIQEEEMADYEDDDLLSVVETPEVSPVQQLWTTPPGRSSPGASREAEDMRISPPYKSISPLNGGQAMPSANIFGSNRIPLWPTPQQIHLLPTPPTEILSPQRGRKRESYPGRLTQDNDLKEGHKKLVTAEGAIDVEPEEEVDDLPETGPTLEEIRAQKVLEWEVEEAEREKERERERRKRAAEVAEVAAANWAAKLAADAELKRQRQEEQRLATYRAEASAGKKRLWLRRWKRRAAIMAEEKRRRKIRAEAALGSLSVGSPLVGPKSDKEGALVAQASGGLASTSMDEVTRVRSEKIHEMWKPLDVASLVLPLFEHMFPTTKFITFKLLLSVGDRDPSNVAGQWLSNKLSRRQLVIPEVHSDGRTPGLWFEVTDIDENKEETALHGASGLVFLVRKGHSIIDERARLHSLVETFPVGVRLPLLLLYSPKERNIEAETEKLKSSLGLFDFEGLRIGWQNVSPVSSRNDGGFYSDGFISGGLVWLANSASGQPNLRPIHVRELVSNNLDGHGKILLASSSTNVTPERCISIFNRSLKSAAMEIRKAVGAAPPHWPPPEAESEVRDVLPGVLPQQGWNEPDLLDPIFKALHLAQLPRFPLIEQLKPSSPTSAWENVRYQKAAVERALQKYLASVDKLKEDDPVLVRQVQVMVQRNSSLEWTDSGRVLVPRWANIFQAIYQTRLLLLNSEPPPTVYIVSKDEEVERPLELDEVEQLIPFAKEIAAGTPFGRTRQVNLVFDDREEQQERSNLQEKLTLAKSYADRIRFEEHESTILSTEHATPQNMEDMSPFVVQGNTWSVFAPSLESWQQDPSASLKKRRLGTSFENAIEPLHTNLINSGASTMWTETTGVSDLQATGSPGSSPLENSLGHKVSGTFKIPRLPLEIEIDIMFTKLDSNFDRALRRASSDMCFADTRLGADFDAEGASNERSYFDTEGNISYDRTVERRESGHTKPCISITSSGMESIDDMLERCWRAQKSIDRKLEYTFGIAHV